MRALGKPIIARGALELLWEACYEAGDDYVGTAADIETLVGWDGEAGMLTKALVEVGAPEGHGFLEPVVRVADPSTQGPVEQCYRVHDLWHHAPDYVKKRREREIERQQKTAPGSGVGRTAPNGGQSQPSPDCSDGDGRTPSPAPSPAPSPSPRSEDSAAPHSGTTPVVLTFPTIGTGPKTWDLTEAQCAEWQQAFPGLDVLGECRKALVWVKANQPKTAKGMRAFLVNWFNRGVRRGDNSRPSGLAATRDQRSPWVCPHIEPCGDRGRCATNTVLGRPRKAAVAS